MREAAYTLNFVDDGRSGAWIDVMGWLEAYYERRVDDLRGCEDDFERLFRMVRRLRDEYGVMWEGVEEALELGGAEGVVFGSGGRD